MWFTCQTAEKAPSEPTTALTVRAHLQCVSWPSRSISTVSPAYWAGTRPDTRSPRRRTADARVAMVIPAPDARTTWSAAWGPRVDPPELELEAEPPAPGVGARPPPPEEARP